ncbi:MAG: glycosyltransferase family 39 protein [Planctomycetes bacterium]|nr:glycosyltransferase family 39 protein [Planctomycetota bacterium]
MRPALALLALAFLLALPQLGGETWSGTEARRVQIALEMAQSGQWLLPTLGHEPTLAKPPLYYWLLAPLVGAFGPSPAATRVPSVLAHALLAAYVFALLRRRRGPHAGLVAALAILLMPVLLEAMPRAEIDPLFTAFTAVSLLALADACCGGPRSAAWLAGVCGGLALLTKGPPYLLFLAGMAVAALRGRGARESGRSAAMLAAYLVPLVALPLVWLVPLLGKEVDAGEASRVAGEESVGRLLYFTREQVVETPGYLLRMALLTLPLGLFVFARPAAEETAPERRFARLCAWGGIGAILLVALFPGRPTRYLLPGFPLLVVALLPRVLAWLQGGGVPRWLAAVVRGLGLAGVGLLAAVPLLPAQVQAIVPGLALGLGAVPLVARTRAGVLAALALVCASAAWSVFAHPLGSGPRTLARAGATLAEEVRTRAAQDLGTRGHFPSQVLLAAGLLPPGDELAARAPRTRWLLVEDPDAQVAVDASRAEGYEDRVRLRVRGKTLVLQERR